MGPYKYGGRGKGGGKTEECTDRTDLLILHGGSVTQQWKGSKRIMTFDELPTYPS